MRPRFVRCRRRSWSRRSPAVEPVWSGSVAGTAALCRSRQPEPPDPAGRYSGLAPARSACRSGRASCASARPRRRGRAVGGEVDVPRGAAEIDVRAVPRTDPSMRRENVSTIELLAAGARQAAARGFVLGRSATRGRRRRPPWPCRRAAHRLTPRVDQACALFGSACTASSRSAAASLALSRAR